MTEANPGARVARRLRSLREERLLSQKALAQRAGVSIATVQKIEHGGVRLPRRTTLEKLAKPLGVVVEDLIGAPRPLALPLQLEEMYVAVPEDRLRALSAASPEERSRYVAAIERVILDVLASTQKEGDWADIAADETKAEGERRIAREQLENIWWHINLLSKLRAEATGEGKEPSQEERAEFIAARASVA